VVDAAVLETLRPTLTHLLRNAIDHGIEQPEQRQRCGKRPEGLIRLRGFSDGAMFGVEVSDDGAGVDVDAVRAEAVERGLLNRSPISDDEMLRVLFTPGFTTVRELTPLSGRGVGLDIVMASIEALGGRVHVQSHLGKGTTVGLWIPAHTQQSE